MLASKNISTPGAADLTLDPSAFTVVVAYEDLDAGKHAQKTCDFLMEHLDAGCRFVSQMWKFDALAVPSLREMAARDVALTDLIFISCHGTHDLPIDVKAWIELWLGHHGAAFALVVLFDQPRERVDQIPSIQNYLTSVARRGQLEFFAQPDVWPGRKASSPLGARSELRREPPIQVAAVSTKNSIVSHWGLNE